MAASPGTTEPRAQPDNKASKNFMPPSYFDDAVRRTMLTWRIMPVSMW